MIIKIDVQNKIPKLLNDCVIVCGNSDYEILFSFDSEWDKHTTKTARFSFLQGGTKTHIDVKFEGSACNVPILSNTKSVEVGVYAGALYTTTPCLIKCERSILCDNSIEDDGVDAILKSSHEQHRSELKASLESVLGRDYDDETWDKLLEIVENLSSHNHSNKEILDAIAENPLPLIDDIIRNGRNLIKNSKLDSKKHWISSGVITANFDNGYMVLNKEYTDGRGSIYQTVSQNPLLSNSEDAKIYTASIEVMKLSGVDIPENSSFEIHFGGTSKRLTVTVPTDLQEDVWTKLVVTTPENFGVSGDIVVRIMLGKNAGGFACRNAKLESWTTALESVNKAAHTHENKTILDGFTSFSENQFYNGLDKHDLRWNGGTLRLTDEGAVVKEIRKVKVDGKEHLRLYLHWGNGIILEDESDFIDIPITATKSVEEIVGNITLNGTGLDLGFAGGTGSDFVTITDFEEFAGNVTDGLGHNANLAYAALKVNVQEDADDINYLDAEIHHIFGEVESLTLEFMPVMDYLEFCRNEYSFTFISGATPTVLTLPNTVKWANELTIEANKRYEISIVDNIGLWCAVDYTPEVSK